MANFVDLGLLSSKKYFFRKYLTDNVLLRLQFLGILFKVRGKVRKVRYGKAYVNIGCKVR